MIGGMNVPEISRFYGIVIKMFFKPRNMSRPTFMRFTASIWENLTFVL